MKKLISLFVFGCGIVFSIGCSGSGVYSASNYNPAAVTITGGSISGVTVDSTNLVGQGQTWTDVKASRVMDTIYNNDTTRPIQVSIAWESSSLTCSVSFTVGINPDGFTGWVQVASANYRYLTAPSTNRLYTMVPIGYKYKFYQSACGATQTIGIWSELR